MRASTADAGKRECRGWRARPEPKAEQLVAHALRPEKSPRRQLCRTGTVRDTSWQWKLSINSGLNSIVGPQTM